MPIAKKGTCSKRTHPKAEAHVKLHIHKKARIKLKRSAPTQEKGIKHTKRNASGKKNVPEP